METVGMRVCHGTRVTALIRHEFLRQYNEHIWCKLQLAKDRNATGVVESGMRIGESGKLRHRHRQKKHGGLVCALPCTRCWWKPEPHFQRSAAALAAASSKRTIVCETFSLQLAGRFKGEKHSGSVAPAWEAARVLI